MVTQNGWSSNACWAMEVADGKMRLKCPNCTAQYEVPDDVIPEDGRDVQCSNCGNTWFQPRETDGATAEAQSVQDAVWHPEVDDSAEHGPSVNAGADPATEEPAPQPPRRREIDPSVADVLREEAELEVRAREAEALEDQPELGLDVPSEDEATKRARQARERMMRMRGEDPEAAATAAAAAAVASRPKTRGEMLPNIDEINQTLKSSDERREVRSAQGRLDDDERSGGFSRGFIFMLLLFAIAACVYVFAPQITDAVPQLTDPLASYVSAVDQLRLWLDAQLTSLLAMLDEMSSEGSATE